VGGDRAALNEGMPRRRAWTRVQAPAYDARAARGGSPTTQPRRLTRITPVAARATPPTVSGPPAGATPPSAPEPSLLDAKLHPPAVYARTIVRSRLVERLAAEPGVPIVTVIAPPGYGKTELLGQLFAGRGGSAAWVTLDDLDNDPSVLLRSLAAAIDRVGDGSSTSEDAPGETAGPRATSAAALARRLHEPGAPSLLVLDDLHRVTDRDSLDVLVVVFEHLPPGIRVILGSRTVPELPLARYRAQGALLGLDRRDLALDAAETRELAAAVGLQLGVPQAAALADATEGWAAAVYLAALARRREPAAGDITITVSGGDAYIADYLRSELAASFDPDTLAFLASTSIVEVVEPSLADAIADRSGSGALLERLVRSSQLISRVGTTHACRYHHLLRTFLLAEMERTSPTLIKDLHQRAAAWYAAAGRTELAMEHALAARDLELGAQILAPVFLRTWYSGHSDQVERWLRHYGAQDLQRHPALAVLAAWFYALSGQPDAADRAADIAERAELDGPPGDGSASLASARAMLRAAMARRGPDAMLADASMAVAAEQPPSPWRYLALHGLAGAHVLTGDTAAADQLLGDAVDVACASELVPFHALALRSSLAMARGDWATAGTFARESHRLFEGTVLAHVATSIHVHAVSARVAMRDGDLELARRELVHAQLARSHASHAAPWTSVLALMDLARGYLAISDTIGARTVVAEAEAIVRRRPLLGVLVSQLAELRERVTDARTTFGGSSSLTTAELRLLPSLSTPYTFRELGERLYLSPHTVKTQAVSIYRKLDASTRSEAIERAIELGLLEPFPGVPLRHRPRG
jgi:LuxR family transcriptional regulator, maltose regulon positive regulatory protein